MNRRIKHLNAFTLAEVLITLGIIGVVAAVTLPTLISNYKKSVVETKVKKTYALIANAISMSEAKYGEMAEWRACGTTNRYECTSIILEQYIIPELNVSKICGKDNKEECWTPPSSLSGLTGVFQHEEKSVTAILNNGISLYMWAGNQSTLFPHIQIWFDIDGHKKGRNTLGIDVFGLKITYNPSDEEKKGVWFHPLATKTIDEDALRNTALYGCSKDINSIYAGYYCGGLIQLNNWKIPDDYPVKF